MAIFGVMVIAAILCSASQASPGKKCYVKHADIVFVLDSSSSIWRPDFNRQLEFVKNVTDQFNIGFGAKETRIGVVTFSDKVHIQFYLNQYSDAKSVKKAVTSIGYLTGGTNTADAIGMTRSIMFKDRYGSRPDVDHIAVVITDGESIDSKKTLLEADLARAAGIQIFAIGVGAKVDFGELGGIASSPSSKFLHRVASYRTLSTIVSKVAAETCYEITAAPTTPEATTTTTVPTTTATTPSTTPTPRPTTPSTTPTSKPTTPSTPTSKPTTPSTPTSKPTTPSTPTAHSSTPTTRQASPSSTTVTAQSSTSSPTTSTATATTEPLSTTAGDPTTTTAEVPLGDEQIVKLCGGQPADIYFILDSSTSIWTVDFRKQLEFVKSIINTFDVGPSKTRFGLSTFSDTVHPMVDFNQYATKEQLLNAVDNVKYQGGLTFTGDAIEDMLNRAFHPTIARRGVAHIGIVITDGESREQLKTAEQSKLAHKAGIYMFAIGVGKAVNEEELNAIASDPDSSFVYTVKDYDALDTIQNILSKKTCEVENKPTPSPIIKDEPKCTRNSADLIFTMDSRRASPFGSRSIITLIDNVIRDLQIYALNLKIGLLQDACLQNSGDIILTSHAQSFRKQLNDIQYATMRSLINRLRTEMFYLRNPTEKIAVLFVDDKLDQAKDTAIEAQLARRQGIEIFVVAVGNRYLDDQVNALCSAPASQHIIRVPSYSQLLTVRQQLGEKICVPTY